MEITLNVFDREQIIKEIRDAVDYRLKEFINVVNHRHKFYMQHKLGGRNCNIQFKFKVIETENKINAEDYVINYYKTRGYGACRLKNVDNSFLQGAVISIGEFWNTIYNFGGSRTGAPDLMVIDRKTGLYFLVEVKTNDDGIRFEQARWYEDHRDIPVVIFYLKQKIREGKL